MRNINITDEIRKKINDDFLVAIKEANINTATLTATSPKKVEPIHRWVANSIELVLPEYICYSAGHRKFPNPENNHKLLNEAVIKGKYFEKNVDVAISRKDRPNQVEAVVEVKYHTGNLGQNENNNIEQMLGYTANVRGNNILFASFIVAKEKTPYYDKFGRIEKWEDHNVGTWTKYENVLKEPKSTLHRPDAISIILVRTGIESEMQKFVKTEHKFKGSQDEIKLLEQSTPSICSSPNIKSNFLNLGPAEFIFSYAIKIVAKSGDAF